MSAADRDKWNDRYRAQQAPSDPSPFLVSLDDLLPREGRALDVAGGAGRHALWLARRGLAVTLADVSEVALESAARAAAAANVRVQTLQIDLETAPLPPGPWDVIVCTYYLNRPLFASFPAALAPGGWLAITHATRSNLKRNPKPGPEYLLEDGELLALAGELEVVRFEEGWQPSGRHEASLLARRPARWP